MGNTNIGGDYIQGNKIGRDQYNAETINIHHHYPTSKEEPPKDASSAIKQFRTNYEQRFGGRDRELQALNEWLNQTDKRLGLLVAPAGRGKSALVVNWIKQLEAKGEVDVVFHPISHRFGINSLQITLASLIQKLNSVKLRGHLGMSTVRQDLIHAMVACFNLAEIKTICLLVNVNYDQLSGQGLTEKIRELLLLLKRQSRLAELETVLQKERSDIPWSAYFPALAQNQNEMESGSESTRDLLNTFDMLVREGEGFVKPLLVVIDGLDELDRFINLANQPKSDEHFSFPNSVAHHIHLLVTVREEDENDAVFWRKKMGWSGVAIEQFGLKKMSKASIAHLIQQSQLQVADDMRELLTDNIYRLSEEGDPLIADLYIGYLEDQLKQAELTHEQLRQLKLAEAEPGLSPYIEKIEYLLEAIEPLRSKTAMLFRRFALARGRLLLDDLQQLGVAGFDESALNNLVAQSGRLLIGNQDSGYVFSHSIIGRTYAKEANNWAGETKEQCLNRFYQYGQNYFAQLQKQFGQGQPLPISHYLLNHYVEHLYVEKPQGYEADLFALACEAWFKAHWVVSKNYESFLRDIARIWETAEQVGEVEAGIGKPISILSVLFKCAIIHSSIVSIGDIHYFLPALLLRDNLLNASQALANVKRFSDPLNKINAWLSLLEFSHLRSEFDPDTISEIIDSVLSVLSTVKFSSEDGFYVLRSEKACFYSLRKLVKYYTSFTPAQISAMQNIINQLSNPLWHAWGLVIVLPLIRDEKEHMLITNKIVNTSLKINDYENTPHLPYFWKEFANNLSIASLNSACSDVFADDRDERHKCSFLKALAWELPLEKTDGFVKVLYQHLTNLSEIADIIANISPKMNNDEQIYAIAIEFEQIFKQKTTNSNLSLSYLYSSYLPSGCILLLVLANQCRALVCKNKILELVQVFFDKFGQYISSSNSGFYEQPMGEEDLKILYRIIKGELSDQETVMLIRNDKFLAKLFDLKERPSHIYHPAILYCLETESIKALLSPIIRPDNKPSNTGLGQWVDKHGYILPIIASKLASNDWEFLFRVGSGDFGTGYFRAISQNIIRFDRQKDLATYLLSDWLIMDRAFGEGDDILDEICLAIAPYFTPNDLIRELDKNDWGVDTKLNLLYRMAPRLEPEVFRQLALNKNNIDCKIYYIKFSQDEAMRKIFLSEVQHHYAKSGSDDLQAFAKHLPSPRKRFYDSARNKVSNFALRISPNAIKILNKKQRNIHQTDWQQLFGLYSGKPEHVYFEPMQLISDLRLIKNKIQAIEFIVSDTDRKIALKQLTETVIDMRIAYPHTLFQHYIVQCEKHDLWQKFSHIEDVLEILENPTKFDLDFKAYGILLPAITRTANSKDEVLDRLLKALFVSANHLDPAHFVQNHIVLAYFLSGKNQEKVIELAFDFITSNKYRWIGRDDIKYSIFALVHFVPDKLIGLALTWLNIYPSVESLAILIPKIIFSKNRFQEVFSILTKYDSNLPVHKVICSIANQLNGQEIADMIGLVLQRDNPLQPPSANQLTYTFMFAEPDQPIESYLSLCERWIQLAKVSTGKKDAFRAWSLVLNKLSKQPRSVALDHLKWFIPVIPALGNDQDITWLAQIVEEIRQWNWRPAS